MNNENKSLTIYALPVSGGYLTSQIALMCELYEAKKLSKRGIKNGAIDIYPDIMFNSSGGCVTSYLSLAGDFSTDGIMRAAYKLEPAMFIKSWLPPELSFIIPSWVIGSFNGSLYRQGYGAKHLFRSSFTSDSIKRVEIWSGTYDKENCKAQFFCNLGEGESLINPLFFNMNNMFDCMDLKYLNGNLDLIATAALASSSIPVLSPKQNINGIFYSDGGSNYASPLSTMETEICRIVINDNRKIINNKIIDRTNKPLCEDNIDCSIDDNKDDEIIYEIDNKHNISRVINNEVNNERSLRLFYFCSYQMDEHKKTCGDSEIGQMNESMRQIIHSSALHDRNSAINILYKICGENSSQIQHSHIHNMNTQKFAQLLDILEKYLHYVVILYPHNSPHINMIKFNKDDLDININKARNNYGAYIWHYKRLP
jgi:hypothetical protein